MRKVLALSRVSSGQLLCPAIYVVIFLFAIEYFLIISPCAKLLNIDFVPDEWDKSSRSAHLSIQVLRPAWYDNNLTEFRTEFSLHSTVQPKDWDEKLSYISRKRYWRYHNGNHPALYDLVVRQNVLYFIFSVRTYDCKACSSLSKLLESKWTCSFQDGLTTKGNPIIDPSKQVAVVECESAALDIFGSEGVTVSLEMPGENPHRYENIPPLLSPPAIQNSSDMKPRHEYSPTVDIAACTMLRSDTGRYNISNHVRVLEWIAYHRLQATPPSRPTNQNEGQQGALVSVRET